MAINVDFMQVGCNGDKWGYMIANTWQEMHELAAWIERDER